MKKIADAVNPGVLRVARDSEKLKQLVSQCMPAELADQILFLRVAEHKLRITVGNSAWAARLRFHSRDIIRRLGTTATPVREISVHVLPAIRKIEIGARDTAWSPPEASSQTVSRIRQVANSVGGECDDSLGRALSRLASNLDDTDTPD